MHHDAKQAHWNLRGPLYYPLHHALQEYGSLYLKYGDILAERQLSTDGRTQTVAQNNGLTPFPGGYLLDRQVLEIMTDRINIVARRVRDRTTNNSENGDDVTSNKLQDLSYESYELNHQVWQFRVHMQ